MEKKSKKEIDVLILGSSQAGKTLLLESLRNLNSAGVASKIKLLPPTTGFDKQEFIIADKPYSICELGGSLFKNWEKFVPKARALIIVVDTSFEHQLAQEASEIHKILRAIHESNSSSSMNELIQVNNIEREGETQQKAPPPLQNKNQTVLLVFNNPAPQLKVQVPFTSEIDGSSVAATSQDRVDLFNQEYEDLFGCSKEQVWTSNQDLIEMLFDLDTLTSIFPNFNYIHTCLGLPHGDTLGRDSVSSVAAAGRSESIRDQSISRIYKWVESVTTGEDKMSARQVAMKQPETMSGFMRFFACCSTTSKKETK